MKNVRGFLIVVFISLLSCIGKVFAQEPPDTAAKILLFEEGKSVYLEGEFQAAIVIFRKLVDLDMSSGVTGYLLKAYEDEFLRLKEASEQLERDKTLFAENLKRSQIEKNTLQEKIISLDTKFSQLLSENKFSQDVLEAVSSTIFTLGDEIIILLACQESLEMAKHDLEDSIKSKELDIVQAKNSQFQLTSSIEKKDSQIKELAQQLAQLNDLISYEEKLEDSIKSKEQEIVKSMGQNSP